MRDSFKGDGVVLYIVSAYFIKIKLLQTLLPAMFLKGLLAMICQLLRSQWATFLRDFQQVSSITAAYVAGCLIRRSIWCCL